MKWEIFLKTRKSNVIPAQAGIQRRHIWMPACPGLPPGAAGAGAGMPASRSMLFLITLTVAVSLGFASHELQQWKKIGLSMREGQVSRIFHSSQDPSQFWVTTPRALYQTNQFKNLSLLLNKNVRWVYQDPNYFDLLYVATDEGLYSNEQGKGFQKIFQASDRLKRQCLSISSADGILFLGTRKGLLTKEEDSDHWQSVSGKLADTPIFLLASFGNVIYVTTDKSLYRYDPSSNSYKKIFSTGITNWQEEAEEEASEESTDTNGEILDVDVVSADAIYVTTKRGIFYTSNGAITWGHWPGEGLPQDQLTALIVDQKPSSLETILWVATSKGVYRYGKTRWEQIYQGLETNQVFDLVKDEGGNLYAATSRGIFILPSEQALPGAMAVAAQSFSNGSKVMFSNYDDIQRHFQNEPTIREVQEMAVDYADVHPDKIKRWHRQARMRAFVPTLSAGLDRSAADLTHWDTGPNPDVLSKGKDFLDWDVGLSWDFGDLVWSTDQTSIDSRSKLMVELREEVLDQVTRVYFERRRLQVELLNQSDAPVDSMIDSQMRLAELTAVLDAFTGGGFSKVNSVSEGKIEVRG